VHVLPAIDGDIGARQECRRIWLPARTRIRPDGRRYPAYSAGVLSCDGGLSFIQAMTSSGAKLRTSQTQAAPPALSGQMSASVPLRSREMKYMRASADFWKRKARRGSSFWQAATLGAAKIDAVSNSLLAPAGDLLTGR